MYSLFLLPSYLFVQCLLKEKKVFHGVDKSQILINEPLVNTYDIAKRLKYKKISLLFIYPCLLLSHISNGV